jgi:hypothetical protein
MKRARGGAEPASLMVRCSLLASVLLAGCTYWGRRRVDEPTPVNPQNPVFIWSRRGVEKWHGVVITQDSVSGIPYETTLKCTRCRRSIPRVQVDSMKLYYHTLPEYVVVTVGAVAVLTLAEAAVCTVVAPRDPQC